MTIDWVDKYFFCAPNEEAAQGRNSSMSRLQSAVCRGQQINKGLYNCTRSHKHGGRDLPDDLDHQHNFAMSCVHQCLCTSINYLVLVFVFGALPITADKMYYDTINLAT